MEIEWKISERDVALVKTLVQQHSQNSWLLDRERRNLATAKPAVTRNAFWQTMVSMRLTTPQRSGPSSAVAAFNQRQPFPLRYELLKENPGEQFIRDTLRTAGLLRFINRIAKDLSKNFSLLEDREWPNALERCNRLTLESSRETERAVADYIADHFLGFESKQARNLLQELGLTRYEIPIDSRMTRWLNDFGFPVRLSATALGDRNYYRFVSDGIQALCAKAGVLPCIFDIAMFVSMDEGN